MFTFLAGSKKCLDIYHVHYQGINESSDSVFFGNKNIKNPYIKLLKPLYQLL